MALTDLAEQRGPATHAELEGSFRYARSARPIAVRRAPSSSTGYSRSVSSHWWGRPRVRRSSTRAANSTRWRVAALEANTQSGPPRRPSTPLFRSRRNLPLDGLNRTRNPRAPIRLGGFEPHMARIGHYWPFVPESPRIATLHRTQEVGGSNPPSSTLLSLQTGAFLQPSDRTKTSRDHARNQGTATMASISTLTPFGNAATPTAARAGGVPPKKAP
jgi:hypothetical protein